jgi:hypothetical protein
LHRKALITARRNDFSSSLLCESGVAEPQAYCRRCSESSSKFLDINLDALSALGGHAFPHARRITRVVALVVDVLCSAPLRKVLDPYVRSSWTERSAGGCIHYPCANGSSQNLARDRCVVWCSTVHSTGASVGQRALAMYLGPLLWLEDASLNSCPATNSQLELGEWGCWRERNDRFCVRLSSILRGDGGRISTRSKSKAGRSIASTCLSSVMSVAGAAHAFLPLAVKAAVLTFCTSCVCTPWPDGRLFDR